MELQVGEVDDRGRALVRAGAPRRCSCGLHELPGEKEFRCNGHQVLNPDGPGYRICDRNHTYVLEAHRLVRANDGQDGIRMEHFVDRQCKPMRDWTCSHADHKSLCDACAN